MKQTMGNELQNDKVDRLSEQIKIQIHLSLTNIVSAGELLCEVKAIAAEKTTFDSWVEKNLGKSFQPIVYKLMRWHEAVKDIKDTSKVLRLIPPTAFIALAHDDVSIENLREIAMTGELKIGDKAKKVQDISTRDIEKIVTENKLLKGLLSQRDLDLKRLESESANLQKQINNTHGEKDSDKCKRLQLKLSQKHEEIARLRKSIASIEPAAERLRSIADFQGKLDMALTSSSAAFLKLSSTEIKETEKENLASSLSVHETMLSDFKAKIGI